MAVFWSYFRDIVGGQKIEDLCESKAIRIQVFEKNVDSFQRKKKLGLGAL